MRDEGRPVPAAEVTTGGPQLLRGSGLPGPYNTGDRDPSSLQDRVPELGGPRQALKLWKNAEAAAPQPDSTMPAAEPRARQATGR